MKIWKFFGLSSRQALRQVKDALGPDAVILSNRTVDGGVEMSALDSGDAASIATTTRPRAEPAAPAEPVIAQPAPMMTQPAPQPAPMIVQSAPQPAPMIAEPAAPTFVTAAQAPAPGPVTAPEPAATPLAAAPAPRRTRARKTPAKAAAKAPRKTTPKAAPDTAWAEALTQKVMLEMQSMRSAFERCLVELVPAEGKRQDLARSAACDHLETAGFGGAFAAGFIESMPAHTKAEEASGWAQHALSRKLTIPREEEIVARGGVYALVGPTGVGKTTTTAKIAARCVMRHGADKVALITTDSYRIGAQEQLRIYARILGVPVHVVRDGAELKTTLADLSDRHVVLIDTMGMSQRDRLVPEQVAMLGNAGVEVRRLLVLNATATRETLEDVVRAYGTEGLSDCVITKTDEAATIGGALEVALRARLSIHYLANGQRVPEDLRPAKRAALIAHAFDAPAKRAVTRASNVFALEPRAA